MPEHRIVAVWGRGLVPADEPVIRADDRGVLHGDGLFETVHVRAGHPWLWAEHLARLNRSAIAVDLRLPAAAELTDLVGTTCAAWPSEVEGALRVVCTRGPESGGPPTVFTTLTEVPASARYARRAGVRVACLPLGVTAGARPGLPWLPAGLKSISYAVNQTARRWTVGNGVDDVLWVSADGYALESPAASLVWLDGHTLCTVPAASTGILPGVTATWLLAHAGALGFEAAERMISPAGLLALADGAWFSSSVRGLVEIRSLDGVIRPASPHTSALQELLGFPR